MPVISCNDRLTSTECTQRAVLRNKKKNKRRVPIVGVVGRFCLAFTCDADSLEHSYKKSEGDTKSGE